MKTGLFLGAAIAWFAIAPPVSGSPIPTEHHFLNYGGIPIAIIEVVPAKDGLTDLIFHRFERRSGRMVTTDSTTVTVDCSKDSAVRGMVRWRGNWEIDVASACWGLSKKYPTAMAALRAGP